MTLPLVVDSSALLCRYLADHRSAMVDQHMAEADDVVVTAMVRSEVTMALHHALGPLAVGPAAVAVWDQMAVDWDDFWVVPLDRRCLFRATELGVDYGLNLTNAMHLAALDRLPRPVRLLTVDDRQVVAAEALGFSIIDVEGLHSTAHGLLA